MARYNIHHPEHYPIGWLSAAKIAAEGLTAGQGQGAWVSADWARGEAGAVCRMKRLRTFRDSINLHGLGYAGVREALQLGFSLAFRKVAVRGVWDVQLCWQSQAAKAAVLEILNEQLKGV